MCVCEIYDIEMSKFVCTKMSEMNGTFIIFVVVVFWAIFGHPSKCQTETLHGYKYRKLYELILMCISRDQIEILNRFEGDFKVL